MDALTLFVFLVALGIMHVLAICQWSRYKRLYVERRASADAQARVIKQLNVDVAVNKELVETLRHRLELKDVNQDQWQELFVD
jgi:sensor domain CHASE-containing protein